jgi:hypothetical protein
MEFVIPISNIDDMNAVNLNICNVQSSWVGHMQSNVNFAWWMQVFYTSLASKETNFSSNKLGLKKNNLKIWITRVTSN